MAEVDDRPAGAPAVAEESSLPGGRSASQAEATPDAIRDALPRGTVVQRYVVVDVLGAGAMGVVYAAYDRDLDRKIALKLVRDPRWKSSHRRLVREAQALAQLSHPNVVAVFDVGTFQDQVFLAMELVAGQTLRSWLKEPRDWPEVVAMFLRAGEGLAAAHAAGVVHRDFKPDNVLIDERGRARVADFGLAIIDEPSGAASSGSRSGSRSGPRSGSGPDASGRARASGSDPDADGHADTVDASDPDAPGTPDADDAGAGEVRRPGALTATGAVVGTPAYMAPEQRSGFLPVDARSDQYSYCVSLHEALCGERPQPPGEVGSTAPTASPLFPGRDRPAGDRPVAAMAVPAAMRHVPARIRRVLARGLAADPAERYPSMDALLTELGHDPRVRRRRAATAVAGVAILGAAALLVGTGLAGGEDERPCRGAADKLIGAWDGPRKQRMQSAFRATGSPLADDAWPRVERAIDGWAGDWAAMHTDTCEATHVRGEQSAQLLDLRMECLDRRRTELRALVDLLSSAEADPQTVARAIQAAQSLPPLDPCADGKSLSEEMRPPSDPDKKSRVAALRERLADLRAQMATGRHEQAMVPARQLVEDARALGYPPVTSLALRALGRLQRQTRAPEAKDTIYDAIAAGEAGHSSQDVAQAWIELVWLVGDHGENHEETKRIALIAKGAIDRLGGAIALEAELESAVGMHHVDRGMYDEGRRRLERALALKEKAFGPEHVQLISPLQHLAILAEEQGDLETALRLYRRGREIGEKERGPENPDIISLLGGEGNVLGSLGRHDEALVLLERGLALTERTFGPESTNAGAFLSGIGYTRMGKKDLAGARRAFERSLAVVEKVYGPDHSQVAAAEVALARLLLDLERPGEALVRFRRSARIHERTLGTEHPYHAGTLEGIGRAYMIAGRPRKAVPPLERAVAILARSKSAPRDLAAAQFELARALVGSSRRSRRASRRALDLAEAALATLVQIGDKEAVAEVSNWITRRR
jgi:eukaryotic-like serine/threonine-protein kinase